MKTTGIKRWVGAIIAFSIMLYGAATSVEKPNALDLRATSNTFSAVAKEAIPAVVFIKVEKVIEAGSVFGPESPLGSNNPFDQFNDEFFRRFFGDKIPPEQRQKYRQMGQGSGFIISKDGYILTNNHVVGDVEKITVQLKDGREFTDAKVIGTDPETEVALIKIPGDDLPVLRMGDSDKIEIGDWAIAIGNPFGLAETVTAGIISAVGRSNVGIAQYENFIQTDAAINPGNSGGPLLNLEGQVIGINTAIFSQSGGYMGIGFAIPINMARGIEEQLIKNGKVIRGYLGIYIQDMTPDLAESFNLKEKEGVLVSEVSGDSPAQKAGLMQGDIILEMNGKKMSSASVLTNEVALLSPGSKADLLVFRDGKKMSIAVEVLEKPKSARQQAAAPQETKEKLGLQLQNLTRDLADQLGYALSEGVLVTEVTPGSQAEEKGIQPGDLVVSINGKNVKSVEDFTRLMKEFSHEKKVRMLIKHGQYPHFVVLLFD
ncbi:MAG: DegQ family serine endoprotease [Desulfobacterales bacterium]|nr:DegQ family serine endoprotease [Desulfobacterales bacterium]